MTVEVDSPGLVDLLGKKRGEDGPAVRRIHEVRRYATVEVRARLHQRAFRERVLEAYRRQCAFCRFRYEELLDAAHIIPDSHPYGEPVVSNGLALCTLHRTGRTGA